MFILAFRRFQVGLFTFGLSAFSMASTALAQSEDLSYGPLSLTESAHQKSIDSMAEAFVYRDQDCRISTRQIQSTETELLKIPQDICHGRTNEIVYLPSFNSLVGCHSQKAEWANRALIGSNGLGKRKSGDRKTPVGTYWLGYPRKSLQFGIFIPVGYPNKSDISKGYTGSAIGIHGPIRPFMCLPDRSLQKDWTAGCLAFARDSQIIAVSNWVLTNWPVKLTVLDN